MIVFFTGTGNSRHLAELAAHSLNDDIVDSTRYIKENERAELYSEKPWVFICPVYAWRMPRVFEKFIREGTFEGSREAYFIIDCDSDIGCAGEKVKALCTEKEFEYRGTAEVWMPESYIAMFTAPDEEKAESIINEADIYMERLVEYIVSGREFPEADTGFFDRCKSGFVNYLFYKFAVKSKAFFADGKCISCGFCENICMLNNIKLVKGKPEWGSRCTHCMACIGGCPKEAIEYGRKTKNKRRYYLK